MVTIDNTLLYNLSVFVQYDNILSLFSDYQNNQKVIWLLLTLLTL